MRFLYQAFGISVELPFRATTRLEAGRRPADLSLFETATGSDENGTLVYENPRRLRDGRPSVTYRRGASRDVLQFTDSVEFQAPLDDRVEFRRLADLVDEQVEAFVLSALIPLRLELSGLVALHCSAVATPAGVVAFLGHSGSGKSSLAAAMLGRGFELVTEDVLPVDSRADRATCVSGYPEIKLASPVGEHVFGQEFFNLRAEKFPGGKRRVPLGEAGLGGFAPGRHGMAALFVLERATESRASKYRQDEIHCEALGRRSRLVELLRFSFHARLVEALDLGEQRLERLARLAERLPVFRLHYPSGIEHLEQVCVQVEERIANPRLPTEKATS